MNYSPMARNTMAGQLPGQPLSSVSSGVPHAPLLAPRLRTALREEGLTVWYQPKFDPQTMEMTGAEALARWFDPEWGSISPCDFVPLAERHGLISQLTEFAIETSLANLQNLQSARVSTQLSVNVSALDFLNPHFAAWVIARIKFYGICPGHLKLELTESTFIRDEAIVVQQMSLLRAQGIHLSIDDFGTGYSSLNRLVSLPVDELKLDKVFISELTESDQQMAFCASIQRLARELNLEIVAEGVEDAFTFSALQDLGYDSVQGYFLAKPMPAEELVSRLTDRSNLSSSGQVELIDKSHCQGTPEHL